MSGRGQYPLQNIVISARSKDGEDIYLKSGYGAEFAGGKIVIPFISASMDNKKNVSLTRFVFSTSKTIDLDTEIILQVNQDFAAYNKSIRHIFTL